jgi:cytochrome c peroxidase
MAPLKYGTVLALMYASGACVTTDEPEVAEVLQESGGGHGHGHGDLPGELPARNDRGIATSLSTLGPINLDGPFFDTTLGSNGRSCESCHAPEAGWGLSADRADDLFDDSDGLDPLFRLHDAGTRPDADISTKKKRKRVFEPVVEKGLIRFGQAPPPATAEFEVIAVADPYGFGTTSAFTRFRRPNPTSNEHFVSSVTWTGGPHDVLAQSRFLFPIAVSFHGQGTVPVPPDVAAAAAEFQVSVVHAQSWDDKAGRLDAGGAKGGPVHLAAQEFFPGINSGASFDPKVFDIFDAWEGSHDKDRRRIARGQAVFNTKTFGPNNDRTCGGCHNTPNVGSSSTFLMLRVGTDVPTDETREYLPTLTLRHKTTGEIREVTDLGRAQSTGLWNDIGRFKVQHLRGLASRTPYFHDGRADTIEELIEHYEAFFAISFTGSEKKDLAAFLYAL